MKKSSVNYVLSVFAVLLCMGPLAAMAQDTPPPLAEMWVMVPKAGHSSEFYDGLEKHMAYRTEQGDPRKWEAYTPLLGDDLNRVAVRFCCFSWADQDSYRAWNEENREINKHFGEHVAPHVEKWEHYFESMDWKNSHWGSELGPYKYFAVTDFSIKAGKGGDFDSARDTMSQVALNQGWASGDHVWLWASTIGGKPQESIIIPHANFASMDRDEDSFFTFLSEHMGAEAAVNLMEKFSDSTWNSNFQIWEHEEDLSMKSGD